MALDPSMLSKLSDLPEPVECRLGEGGFYSNCQTLRLAAVAGPALVVIEPLTPVGKKPPEVTPA